MFINPFGVILGENISGQKRGEDALKDVGFMASIEAFGVTQPVQVQR